MGYVALKPCSFGGQKFLIGETVPAELIAGTAKNLVGMGVIAAKAGVSSTAPSKLEITAEGLDLAISQAGLQAVIDVLTNKAEEAEATIKEVTDTDALILLDILDQRKTVKALAKDQALALNEKGE